MTSPKPALRTFIACAALTLMASSALAASTIDVKQSAALQTQGALLIDVRTPAEFAQGHAPGATLIPLDQLPGRMAELAASKDRPIALICRSGNRSGQAQVMLEKAGFSKTANVAGGMNAWARSGLPVVTGLASK